MLETSENYRYKNGLTQKQVIFCEKYLENHDVMQAAMAAGYGGTSAKAAGCAGWGLLRGHSRTAKLIQQYINKRVRGVQKKMQVGFDEKRKKLWHIADTCAPDVLEPFVDKEGRLVQKIPDPKTAVAAISEMNRMDGDIAAEKRVTYNVTDSAEFRQLKEYEKQLLEKKKQDY